MPVGLGARGLVSGLREQGAAGGAAGCSMVPGMVPGYLGLHGAHTQGSPSPCWEPLVYMGASAQL